MSTPDIIDYLRRIPMAKNSHIHLWVTNSFLEDGLKVLTALGFRYINNTAWVKAYIVDGELRIQKGLGQYKRGSHELCLFGVRGDTYRTGDTPPSVIIDKRGKHSKKPLEMYEHIERISPGPFIEAFARSERVNWDCIGNEAPNSIELKGIKQSKLEIGEAI